MVIRMAARLRFFVMCLIGSALLPSVALADFVWYADTNPSAYSGSSAYSSCVSYAQQNAAAAATVSRNNFQAVGVTVKNAPTQYTCNFTAVNGSGTTISPASATGSNPVITTRASGSCAAGTTFNNATGACDANCTVVGQVHDLTGACNCPAGTSADVGTFADILGGNYPKACQTPAGRCSRRAGQSITSTNVIASIDGCSVGCTATTPIQMSGQLYLNYMCTYSGAVRGAGGPSDPTKPETVQLTPSPTLNPAPPTTEPVNPDGSCPTAGSARGEVNGVMVCVPQHTSSGAPNVAPSAPQTQTSTDVTTSSTVTNSDGSTTTTTTTTTTVNGAHGGSSSGSGSGLGQCDPTAANYATCINLAGAVQAGVTAAGGGSGSGQGSGAGQCDPTAKDYLACLAGDQTATEHTHGSAATFGEALTNFQDQMAATPLGHLASNSGIGGTVNVGSCPTATLELFGHSIVMDSQCSIYNDVSPALTAVMHVVYVCLGILILLSA